MGKTNPDSLMEELNKIEIEGPSSFKRLRDAKKGDLWEKGKGYEHNIRRSYDRYVSRQLNELNQNLIKGNFEYAKNKIDEMYESFDRSINHPNTIYGDNIPVHERFKKYTSEKERGKLVEGINRRVERGIKYLKNKNPSKEDIHNMHSIINTSKK